MIMLNIVFSALITVFSILGSIVHLSEGHYEYGCFWVFCLLLSLFNLINGVNDLVDKKVKESSKDAA